ncbi:MFS transporter [Flavobacterium gawalongense]|uniref:MFS transporter n=1 Tax=Flavobacterium gawalongense TaxID=2594432 RepID=A0A553BW58_9FLAO|nr:MFS transporter [Flavobacterium gawalongense]TRX02039.1 MFS transporter [Flavobacterium gawalongense]TRX06567.1 MFS transporter [Flavobacterium gawalongense]TRX12504.1 MFS transporter [Flavobacterium gawalongense]TRX12675.1 MFS transporter [Flavobacterium gawalongense]TRX30536.1 MFS transporter [Flavobacterium gawalongense]
MIDLNFIGRFRTKAKYKKTYKDAKISYLNRIRWAVSMFYFGMGLCFATWASRIPDIKTALHLSDGHLGTILFALPMGQLVIMPLSGKLVTKFGSHRILIFSLLFYVFSLTNLGLATQAWQLSLGLFVFGIFGNLANISVNTQGVYTEELFKKTIMSSFHGMWSLAGFTGALVGLGMLALELTPYQHFLIVASIVLLMIGFNFKFLIKAKETIQTEKKKLFTKPDSALIFLGIIGFCCMASEGVMFDWSGVYFKDVIKAPGPLVILGYTSFMIMMASGRFFGDGLSHKFGRKKVMQISGCMISVGLFTAVFFPFIIPSTIAFMFVGLGVSTIIPTLYSIAGKHPTIPTGEALTIVSSVSFLGFLMGPPIIGYIAEAFSLRFSFAFIGIFGFFIALMVTKIKAIQD